MHKWYSFKCKTDRKRTRFLWWWRIGFGSFHNKIFILLSSRAIYGRKIKRRSPENLLAHCSLFCQEVKCESRRAEVNGRFYRHHIHAQWNQLHPGGDSGFPVRCDVVRRIWLHSSFICTPESHNFSTLTSPLTSSHVFWCDFHIFMDSFWSLLSACQADRRLCAEESSGEGLKHVKVAR